MFELLAGLAVLALGVGDGTVRWIDRYMAVAGLGVVAAVEGRVMVLQCRLNGRMALVGEGEGWMRHIERSSVSGVATDMPL